MNVRFFLVVACCALATVAGGQEAAKDKERFALDGAWALTRCEENGTTETYQLPRTYRVLIAGDFWASRWVREPGSIGISRMKFKLDPDKTPKEIDLVLTGPKQTTIVGIYSFDGATLTICYAPAGVNRPTEFRTKAGDKRFLLTFKRDVGGPDEPTSKTLIPFLKERFSLMFPDSARIAHFAVQADPITRRQPAREVFAEVTLAPEAYKVFRKRLLSDEKRPDGQRVIWEGQERPMIGGIPGPFNVPRSAQWWSKEGADTLCVLLYEEHHPDPLHGGKGAFTETTKAAVLFLSERQGRIMLWAFVTETEEKEGEAEKPKNKKEGEVKKSADPPGAKPAEPRGVLKVGAPAAPERDPEQPKNPNLRLQASQPLQAFGKGRPLVFEGLAAVPIHRPGPEHFKITRVSDAQAVPLRVAYERDRVEQELGGVRLKEAIQESIYVYNSLFKGTRLFLYNGAFSDKHPIGQAGILNLYGCPKLEAGVRYRLTWACWPVGASKAVEVSCEFEFSK